MSRRRWCYPVRPCAGSYRFENLADGDYFVYATAPGACAVDDARVTSDRFRKKAVDMRLYQSIETSGTVSNAEGEPIPHATVLVAGFQGGPYRDSPLLSMFMV